MLCVETGHGDSSLGVCERAREVEQSFARDGRFRGRSNTDLVNVNFSKPKHCWRRVDFESFESFVRAKRRSTGEVCEY